MTGMQNELRQILRDAGVQEARGSDAPGFRLWISSTPDIVYVEAKRSPDKFQYENSLRWGNELISKCFDALADQGFKVTREPRAGVDRLKVERVDPVSTAEEVKARAERLLQEAKDEMAASEGKPRASTRRLHLSLRILVLEEVLGIPSPFDEDPS